MANTMDLLTELQNRAMVREFLGQALPNMQKDDAMRGELGVIKHPTGISTEKSITVGAPTKYYNIPLLVQGLGPEDIKKIVMNEASQDDWRRYYDNAIKRFHERGGEPKYFATVQQAEEAAKARSASKDESLQNTVPYNAGLFKYDFR